MLDHFEDLLNTAPADLPKRIQRKRSKSEG